MLHTFVIGVLVAGSFSILAGCGSADSVDSVAPEREETQPPAIQGEPTDSERIASPAFMTTLQCGAQRITIGHTDEGMRLTVGDEMFDLRPVEAASGAKYAAVDDPATMFWSKGDRALVEIRGQAYPECMTVTDEARVFRATGNEPFWRLDIDDREMTLLTNFGETRLVAPTPVPEAMNDVKMYVANVDGKNLTVTISAQLCTDTMSGMPHPNTVAAQLDDEILRGCGGDPAALLHGAEWVVEDLNGGALIEQTRVTLNFAADGRVLGNASCNNYHGGYILTGESLTIPQAATTMMACEPELMAQESRFLELLENIQRFEIGADGALILHTGDLRTITARRL
jgi:heat shock protein HslJ/membrane-bound inhibitor of C-type lysozyme